MQRIMLSLDDRRAIMDAEIPPGKRRIDAGRFSVAVLGSLVRCY
jgi:hypothetical protein